MGEKERLELEIQRNEALLSLTKQSGWQFVQEIFLNEVATAFDKLLIADDPEARAVIGSLNNIYSLIDGKIKLIDKLKERYTRIIK